MKNTHLFFPECEYNGEFYEYGEIFTSADRCTECTCKQGTVECFENPCGELTSVHILYLIRY